ncbi:unnamed protein product [Candidula unifasciata]|uniref:Uncharacterized protein n=1 Tax=Candidula unifasciata TaxID=100452 RepID=A0A8S3YZC0_9EUPU|nr:unnamed protein product [Candidula unifasciata]
MLTTELAQTMTDNPQGAQQNVSGEDSRPLERESQAMRSVVRSMVANMEHVINDLQGIMGDIQSLVVQIDTVTDQIDKQCGAHLDGSDNPSRSQYCVRRPHFVHGTQLCTGSVHNAIYSQVDSEKSSASENMPATNNCSRHSVVRVKAFRRDSPAEEPNSQDYEQPICQSGVSISLDQKKDARLPCSSRSFSHFSKESSHIVSPSGGIAIVYPTIKSNPVASSDTEPTNEGCDVKKISVGGLHLQNSSPLKRRSLLNKPLQIFSKLLFHDNESTENKQTAAKQRHGVTSVYNMSFQPVTPTEQRSPIISPGHKSPHLQTSMYDILKSSTSSRAALQDGKPHRISCPTPEKSYISSSPSHKYCTIGGSLSKSLQTHYESSVQNQNVLASPLLKRSSARAVYSKVLGSPASSRRSPGTFRRLGRENYYFSIESDLDSEALIENIDNRSLTPDIDWSYLNLFGSEQFTGNQTRIFHTPESDHGYEIPVVPTKVTQQFQLLQTSPDVVGRLPVIKIQPVSTAEPYLLSDSNISLQLHNVVDEVYTHPVMAHIFCSEVSSFKTSGYCGWYESVMDSVLENVAGFESFEEACEDFENSETLNETYISFEDQFEEDDWDMGMESEDQFGFGLHPFDFQTLYGFGGLFARLQVIDDNSNLFSGRNNLASVSRSPLYTKNNDRGNRLLVRDLDKGNEASIENVRQQRSSTTFTDTDIFEDLSFADNAGKSFTDDDCCAIKPSVTDQHQNFILWQKALVPRDLRLLSDGTKSMSVTECETEMSSSDDTSCQAVGTGSPMSFSSPEGILTSPDTDRFVTSSEGDDLFTSQEDAYFHFSETQDNANVSAARATMLQLRREFFESLYNVCERREKEMSQDSESKLAAEERDRYDPSFPRIDNSRDNVSETGSYQEDVTSYNKSINTWTAYAMVHLQADDISDSTSDIFNENNINCSMTSSYLDADNIGSAPENQGLIC